MAFAQESKPKDLSKAEQGSFKVEISQLNVLRVLANLANLVSPIRFPQVEAADPRSGRTECSDFALAKINLRRKMNSNDTQDCTNKRKSSHNALQRSSLYLSLPPGYWTQSPYQGSGSGLSRRLKADGHRHTKMRHQLQKGYEGFRLANTVATFQSLPVLDRTFVSNAIRDKGVNSEQTCPPAEKIMVGYRKIRSCAVGLFKVVEGCCRSPCMRRCGTHRPGARRLHEFVHHAALDAARNSDHSCFHLLHMP